MSCGRYSLECIEENFTRLRKVLDLTPMDIGALRSLDTILWMWGQCKGKWFIRQETRSVRSARWFVRFARTERTNELNEPNVHS